MTGRCSCRGRAAEVGAVDVGVRRRPVECSERWTARCSRSTTPGCCRWAARPWRGRHDGAGVRQPDRLARSARRAGDLGRGAVVVNDGRGCCRRRRRSVRGATAGPVERFVNTGTLRTLGQQRHQRRDHRRHAGHRRRAGRHPHHHRRRAAGLRRVLNGGIWRVAGSLGAQRRADAHHDWLGAIRGALRDRLLPEALGPGGVAGSLRLSGRQGPHDRIRSSTSAT